MNIAFFLTPKSEVVYLSKKMTLRQAMEKMEYHRYKAIPILDEDGGYYGVLTEGRYFVGDEAKSAADISGDGEAVYREYSAVLAV